jgi:hypothetical protein
MRQRDAKGRAVREQELRELVAELQRDWRERDDPEADAKEEDDRS